MSRNASLSATNIAVHHHLNCDLYVHNVYWQGTSRPNPDFKSTVPKHKLDSELLRAQFKRGTDWEDNLDRWLDDSDLLLRVPTVPLEIDTLIENIQADERDHFFIANLTFFPPQDNLNKKFHEIGSTPVKFGLAKPDLLEITRISGGVKWKVIDAKASKTVKTSHHVQIYFYTLCLNYLLRHPFFHSTGTAGVWIPPKESATPHQEDIKTIDIALLSSSLDQYLFYQLPGILSLPHDQVEWHFNPLCRSCNFETECRTRAVEEKTLGIIPNISIDDAHVLKDLLRISHTLAISPITDIEDLHLLLSAPSRLGSLSKSSPSLLKRSKQILALPRRRAINSALLSPVVEAVRLNEVKVIPQRNFTCPSREDIAIIISLTIDPSSPALAIGQFCIATYSAVPLETSSLVYGPGDELITSLAHLIRTVLCTQSNIPGLSTQFYVWSSTEQVTLQNYLVNCALTANADDSDIRLCIGALAQGASLLQTTFQPTLLSGALLSFLAKGKRTKVEHHACLKRMGLPTTGTAEELRKRVDAAIRTLQQEAELPNGIREKYKEFGQLPRVVVLKREVERLLALPVAGYWDLPECTMALLPDLDLHCPSDEDIFTAYKMEAAEQLAKEQLLSRNRCIYAVLKDLRSRTSGHQGYQLLVNEAKMLSGNFMDLCIEDNFRKLFFMQQFEVLAKLTELWQTRIDGCPNAPVIAYESTVQGKKGLEHGFRLVSGVLDVPADKDQAFFDKLLVQDSMQDDSGIPVEALFDDLAVSGLVFPLNRYTKASWDVQHPIVQRELVVADVQNVAAEGQLTLVTLRVWGPWQVKLEKGSHYRLSPRLVDFNTTKILSALFEHDLLCSESPNNHYDKDREVPNHYGVPLLQLIVDPKSFGKPEYAQEYLKVENGIQKLFRNLRDLGNEVAGALVLKPSQHKATHRILTNRLSVIWGPPGTGKTYTISLSLLRLAELQHRLKLEVSSRPKIVFITAMTHAAIDACRNKLLRLITNYRSIDSLTTEWLDDLQVEQVIKGNEHPAPAKIGVGMHIYTGTIYQLYNFTKRHSMAVDCVVVDEAGQIALGSIALVLRSLSPTGRIIIAGDSEQLAPILTAQYPSMKERMLFGSVLDCLMHSATRYSNSPEQSPSMPEDGPDLSSSQSTIVQLTENFRLNPDLGEFVSTIYSRQFKPQKVQARQLATALKSVEEDRGKELGVDTIVLGAIQTFLVALSRVMLRHPQTLLRPPTLAEVAIEHVNLSLTHHPVSLALIKLKTVSQKVDHIGYELHVHGEAAVAAALVASIRRISPHEDIFVATPHRIQREAVKTALLRLKSPQNSLEEAFDRLTVDDPSGKVTVDTVERLQGSEAAFVICLFSIPKSFSSGLEFLLERRRLNVAISRAKTLCILVTSEEVLCPPVRVLANEETAKGFAFLKAYEERAWSFDLQVNVDTYIA